MRRSRERGRSSLWWTTSIGPSSTFLDLVEHIADFSRDFPILLISIARPELFDARPGWGAGKRNATSTVLERLSDAECRELISNLLGRAPLPPAAEFEDRERGRGQCALR